jgi:hypothetical protein
MPDEHMRRGCSAIICNLAAQDGSERQLINAGIVPTLLVTALITSDEYTTKFICLKALVNLMVDTCSYKTMVKEGFIWGLSSLALMDDMEVMTLCAKALCNLSRDYAREMLDSAATVKTVMMMINRSDENAQDLELLKNGCRVLINMLARSTDQDEKFRLLAVQSMDTMAKSCDDEISEMFILCLCLASQSEGCRPAMVSSGLLASIDTRSIFKDARIGFAYLTMYRNIANDPLMRTEVVDSQSVQRFMDISKLRNPELDEAVGAALYCISCSAENLVNLTQQDAVAVVRNMFEAPGEKKPEFIRYLVGILYNLSTCPAAQAQLVQLGFVKVALHIFQEFKEEELICRMLCLSICHLACGQVNTSMMVRDGASELMVFMANNVNSIRHKFFHTDDISRTAASFRNLTCVVANQKRMVDEGAIEAIVGISHYTSGSHKTVAHQARRNSAAALKSMTYNTEIRVQLVECEAIDIILHDLEKEMESDKLQINHDLLCDLEAESWENGSRGSVKDGRAVLIPPGEIFLDLLTGSNNVQLDVEHRVAPLAKMLVEIHLDEPPIQSSVQAHNIEVTFDDLPHYETDRETNEYSQMIDKMECVVSEVAVAELKARDVGDGIGSPTFAQSMEGYDFGSDEESHGDMGVPVLKMPAPSLPPNGGGTHSTAALGFTDDVTLMDKENASNADRKGVIV